MQGSKSYSKVGVILCALLFAATWITHLESIRHHGARYTYAELAVFAGSMAVGLVLALRAWEVVARRFILAWIGATLLAAICHTAFDFFVFSGNSGVPWVAQASAVVIANLLGAFTVDAPAFLALFAGAAWISHRLVVWRVSIFIFAGSLAMVAPYVVWGVDFDSFAMAWWPFRAADVACGTIAGVTFWYFAVPTTRAPAVSA